MASSKVKQTWQPKDWQQQLQNIRVMRTKRDAPVDTVGASELPESSITSKVNSLMQNLLYSHL